MLSNKIAIKRIATLVESNLPSAALSADGRISCAIPGEPTMSITVVLGVGLDSWLLAANDAAWRSSGFIVVPAATVREAITHFQAGDFDLVLLGRSVSNESKERLSFLIHASGSQTPVVSIANLAGDLDLFADITIHDNSNAILSGMVELLAERERLRQTSTHMHSIAT